MIATNNETYEFKVIPVVKNSAYESDKDNTFTFKGRPASPREIKNYRLQQGVNASSESIYIVATNLPREIKVGDTIKFLGKKMLVESIGYYFEQNRIVDASIFSEEYLISQCPKGLTLA